MRLDKFLAETGFGTRSEVKKLIRSAVVSINGTTVKKPDIHVDCENDIVAVGGNRVIYKKFIYLMLNKPQNFISATRDGRLPTVLELIPDEYRHFQPFPVGRLDIDTEGLLILTNNGEMSHRLLSPRSHVPKTYIAHLDAAVTNEDIHTFFSGVTLDDGYKTMPAELKILSNDGMRAEITIHEGKFHQIKRMFEAVGKTVVYLKRIKMNSLSLDESIPLGGVRELTDDELDMLQKGL